MKRCLLHLAILHMLLSGAPILAGLPAAQAGQTPSAPDFLNQRERLPLPALRGLDRLRFVTTVDFPPFNRLNERGQLSGYNIDLARALCRQLAIEDICQIEAVPWNELERRVADGEAEAIIAGWQPTDDNRAGFAFTRSYMRLPARFVTLTDRTFTRPAAEATRGKPVGVIAGTAHEQLLKTYFPEAEARPYPDRAAMLNALKGGKVDSVFDDGLSLSFWLNGADSGDCCAFTDGPYLAPHYLGAGLSIAVAKPNAAIAEAFDNALQSLQQKGVLTELYLRYFPTSFY